MKKEGTREACLKAFTSFWIPPCWTCQLPNLQVRQYKIFIERILLILVIRGLGPLSLKMRHIETHLGAFQGPNLILNDIQRKQCYQV